MKRFLFATALVAATPLALAADVGVSVSIGQPGFYGHIDIGSFPQPQLIYPQPVLIQQVPRGVVLQPIYLHVPPGHAKNWSKHCYRYNACGQPVYFVQDNWYNEVYVPHYRNRGDERGYRDDRRDGDDHRHRDERGDDGDGRHDRGHGRGHRDD